MHIRILGSAAGGRFPQWNCGCGNCTAVRNKTFRGKERTQAQLALSGDGSTWFLAGASPDLAFQIESSPPLHPRELRDSPIAGVVLASADLDHVVGLLLLRELQPLRVYAAPSILRILREENSMFGMLNRADPQVLWTPMTSGAPFPLLSADGKDSGLRCEVHYLSGRFPKYVKSKDKDLAAYQATAALFFESASGKRVAYVPAVGNLSDALLEKIGHANLLLFDGTFWSDDELRRVQGSGETAHQMGHIPVEESLRLLKDISINVGRKMFIHINNTNPILNEASPEHQAVLRAGWEVAEDNCELEL
ncbi:MAG TPA: pyrroloquinoline quinone biosynthesis protein PqqB [Terriglobales bacterium]|nr:pyrroloquinoline quinone biosynthesis protein PqqB [Terriglobales bacterium]